MARVSVGQAAVTALQTWLRRSLPEDVAVYDRWPDADVRLFAPAQAGLPPSRAVVSVMKVGRRQRVDVIGPSPGPTITPDGAGKFLVTFRLGSYVQPVQLDLWTASDVDRDDVLDQLDTALTAGIDKTLGIVGGDPVRDGVLRRRRTTARPCRTPSSAPRGRAKRAASSSRPRACRPSRPPSSRSNFRSSPRRQLGSSGVSPR